MFTTFTRRAAMALAIGTIVSMPVFAKAPGTGADAQKLAEQAMNHVKKVGFEQAVKDFNADQATWGLASRDKVVYITTYSMDGTVLAHSVNASLVGRNLIAMKDQNGKEVIKEGTAIAKAGPGKVSWMWAHPLTKKISNAEGFVIPVPGKDALLWGVAFVD
jgi:cytochrome c